MSLCVCACWWWVGWEWNVVCVRLCVCRCMHAFNPAGCSKWHGTEVTASEITCQSNSTLRPEFVRQKVNRGRRWGRGMGVCWVQKREWEWGAAEPRASDCNSAIRLMASVDLCPGYQHVAVIGWTVEFLIVGLFSWCDFLSLWLGTFSPLFPSFEIKIKSLFMNVHLVLLLFSILHSWLDWFL